MKTPKVLFKKFIRRTKRDPWTEVAEVPADIHPANTRTVVYHKVDDWSTEEMYNAPRRNSIT